MSTILLVEFFAVARSWETPALYMCTGYMHRHEHVGNNKEPQYSPTNQFISERPFEIEEIPLSALKLGLQNRRGVPPAV